MVISKMILTENRSILNSNDKSTSFSSIQEIKALSPVVFFSDITSDVILY